MTVETNANYISDFNKAYPRNRDLIKEGDDHIRLVKAVLQNTFPGMDGAVNPSSEKLNKLDATFTYEGSTLNIKNSITLAEGKDVNLSGAVVSNIGDPVEPTDAVNLRSIQGSLMWPVGSIFMTVDSRNPREIFGFGTWEKFAQGRVIIGTGTTTDANGVTKTFLNESKGGNYQFTLEDKNIPSHKHDIAENALKLKTEPGHRHNFCSDDNTGSASIGVDGIEKVKDYKTGGADGGGSLWMYRTSESGSHTHLHEKGVTDLFGSGDSVEHINPYIPCNIWKRIADTDS